MPSRAEIVEQYFDAWTSKDFEAARSLLDDHLSFRGPVETLDSADALMNAARLRRSHADQQDFHAMAAS